jgi:dienelactone hydrolase
MRCWRFRSFRPLAAATFAIVTVAGLAAGLLVRQGHGTVRQLGGKPKVVTLDISDTTRGSKMSHSARTFKVDAWYAVDQAASSPVSLIVYIPAWGSKRSDNTALLTALVNAGYVVLAMDDIAHDAPYADPLDDAARSAPYDLSTETATRQFIGAADRRAALQSEKVSRVLDALSEQSATLPQLSSLSLSSERVGALGYSFGGATAAEAGKKDPRVVAVVNLDGWQFGPGIDQAATFPYLIINGIQTRLNPEAERLPDSQPRNEALLNAAENARQILQATARQDTYRLYLRGARHSDLSDSVGAWRRVLSRLKHGSSLIAPAQARRAIDAAVVSFFDMYVRQNPKASLANVIATHQDLIALGTRPFR